MGKFKVVKKIDLSYLGDDWKDCYISLLAPSYKDLKDIVSLGDEETGEATAKLIVILKDLFIEGLGATEKGKESLKKEDLEELPLDILTKVIQEITGTPNPN